MTIGLKDKHIIQSFVNNELFKIIYINKSLNKIRKF